VLDCKGDRGIRQVGDHADAIHVEPFARDRRGDVGLVAVLGFEDLDPLAQRLAAVVLGRHACRNDTAGAR
jgi:hypothetical protein